MYKTIIFDVDGTLIDTEMAVLGSLQKLLQEYGQAMPQEQLKFVLGIPGAAALKELRIEAIDEANARWNEHMIDFAHTIAPFDGVSSLLADLQAREVQTGIVTSKTTEELQADFMPHGLMPYLHAVVCADDTERHKPHPDPLLKFLQNTGADPATAIYIGDTAYDAQCARDAGIVFGLALWGCGNPEGIDADHTFSHPSELLSWVADGREEGK